MNAEALPLWGCALFLPECGCSLAELNSRMTGSRGRKVFLRRKNRTMGSGQTKKTARNAGRL